MYMYACCKRKKKEKIMLFLIPEMDDDGREHRRVLTNFTQGDFPALEIYLLNSALYGVVPVIITSLHITQKYR